jgi:hypothetical protein
VLEACKILEKLGYSKILEFQTYRREDAPTVHAHLFEPLNYETAHATTTEHPKILLIRGKEDEAAKPSAGDFIEIELKSPSERKFALFNINDKIRAFFPPYKIDFILETDLGEIKTRITSAPGTTQIGDALAGSRIQGGLVPWFKKHAEADVGTKVRIESIEPQRRYKLTVI